MRRGVTYILKVEIFLLRLTRLLYWVCRQGYCDDLWGSRETRAPSFSPRLQQWSYCGCSSLADFGYGVLSQSASHDLV